MYIEQNYSKYTEADQQVWEKLCERRLETLRPTACKAFLDGYDIIRLSSRHIPYLNDVNSQLEPITGWKAMPVAGYLPARDFFKSLSERKFPTTITIRPMNQLDYLPEPDIFHDVFGHVPLHADKTFGDFLQHYGKTAYETEDEQKLIKLTRLFWFTVEFGLIREEGEIKIFGSGLVSSLGEGEHCFKDDVKKLDFDLEKIVNQSFEIDHYQPILFVIDSFEQLYDAVEKIKN
jgi:phenylalanine-4-hydroxylase